jgi:AcrR family transcriptional regulator
MPNAESRLSTLQQERSRHTRARLVRAAETLWRNQGFESSTVGAICARAGVSKGTFYFYFRHKEDLLVELGMDAAERVATEQARADDERPTRAVVHDTVAAIAARVDQMPSGLLASILVELHRSLALHPPRPGERDDIRGACRRIVDRGVRRGELDPDIDTEDAAAAMTAVVMDAMLVWAQGRAGDRSLAAAVRARVEIVLRGLAAEP